MHTDWPNDISRSVHDLLGSDPDVSHPGGMSGASVQRLRARNGSRSLILKRSTSEREWHVYTALGDTLRNAGVDIPALYAHAVEHGTCWLLLEDIASPLPEERRLADPAVLAVLRNLHGIPPVSLPMSDERYVPVWTEPLTQQAMTLFDPAVADSLAQPLERMRLDCQRLFTPQCLISADPNPANWGLRQNGRPVLFDWERCTLGTPALDLGICVPGCGSRSDFAAVAVAYSGNSGLAGDIALAKVWSVVEFLAGYAEGQVEPAFDIAILVERIPAWLETLQSN